MGANALGARDRNFQEIDANQDGSIAKKQIDDGPYLLGHINPCNSSIFGRSFFRFGQFTDGNEKDMVVGTFDVPYPFGDPFVAPSVDVPGNGGAWKNGLRRSNYRGACSFGVHFLSDSSPQFIVATLSPSFLGQPGALRIG